jgi:hypothetical protein
MAMGNRFLYVTLLLFLYWSAGAQSASVKVRKAFYAVLSTGNLDQLKDQIERLESLSFEEKSAFVGVLKIRTSEFTKGVKNKLDLFKSGRMELEDQIAQHKYNAEYRFLRLIIQENAPAILKYKGNLNEDAKLIKASYHKFTPETKAALLDYCKRSKILKVEDFDR